MNNVDQLAARLRQAVQGCCQHLHGPVQAWRAVREAHDADQVDEQVVARAVIAQCEGRIAELVEIGAQEGDPRILKERYTAAFVQALFSLEIEPLRPIEALAIQSQGSDAKVDSTATTASN